MVLIVDGVEYDEYSYSNEQELEESLKCHAKDMFGENSVFFEKQRLKSLAGMGSIPDGFVVDFANKCFYVVEVELSSHDVYQHIVNQLTRFINGMRNPKTHKRLVGSIYEEIKDHPELRREIQNTISEEIYRFLDDLVPTSNPTVIIVIDNRTEELDEARGALQAELKVKEFKTFVRRGIGDLRVHAHIFEPITSKPGPPGPEGEKVKVKREIKRGKKTPEKEYFIPLLESLIEMGGSGKIKKVVDKVGEKMKDNLNNYDWQQLKTGEIRWRNTAEWARNTLKNRGLLKSDSPRGIWEISEKGRRYYKEKK